MARRKANELSEYERERLERIKENEKVLEELFPGGTDSIYVDIKGKRPSAVKRRRELDGNSRGSGSGASSDYASDSDHEQGSTRKKLSVK